MGAIRRIVEAFERVRRQLAPFFTRSRVPTSLSVDERGVALHHSDGEVELMAWNDLQEVTVITTDTGPYQEDVFILLAGRDGKSVTVPQQSDREGRLADRLLRLPGFDQDCFVDAMSCTRNHKFLCWKKE